MEHTQDFLNQVRLWGIKEESILGIALVGSYARDAAKESSDIDLIIITKDPQIYLKNDAWIYQFGLIKEEGIKTEDWGLVKTKRVFYTNGIEAEFNFSTPEWTNTNPIDDGTKKVMTDGNKILVDKKDLFKDLLTKLQQ